MTIPSPADGIDKWRRGAGGRSALARRSILFATLTPRKLPMRTNSLRLISLAMTALLLAGCASKPTIRSNVDPAANFAAYKTFAFLDEVSGKKTYDSFASTYIKNAVVREMQARGVQKSDTPDLLVNIHVQTKDKVDVNQTP